MTIGSERLHKWLTEIELSLKQNIEITPIGFSFLSEPELIFYLVDAIVMIDEPQEEFIPTKNNLYLISDTSNQQNVEQAVEYIEDMSYTILLCALEVCIVQLQTAKEKDNKVATKILDDLMDYIANNMQQSAHTLEFWLPIINTFYDIHIDLNQAMKNAYMELALDDEWEIDTEDCNILQELIDDMSDLSIFDIAENFFAQSYAMPDEFYIDFISDLLKFPSGVDIAVLSLLHPKFEIRNLVVICLDKWLSNAKLSDKSYSHLQAIKNWYPALDHQQFATWLQSYPPHSSFKIPLATAKIKATEIDGDGAQGIYLHLHTDNGHRLCGILVERGRGIKDAWVTNCMNYNDFFKFYKQIQSDSCELRVVDYDYLTIIINHFLAVGLQRDLVPDLHLLEIQELIGVQFKPQFIDFDTALKKLILNIPDFAQQNIHQSFKRSKAWSVNKQFTESWYIENARIDKLVNRHSSIVNGVKFCDIELTMADVFKYEFNQQSNAWKLHFLWMAMLSSVKPRKNEKIALDSLIIANAMHNGMNLQDIPIMQAICKHTVINSIETMHERRTYLSKEI